MLGVAPKAFGYDLVSSLFTNTINFTNMKISNKIYVLILRWYDKNRLCNQYIHILRALL